MTTVKDLQSWRFKREFFVPGSKLFSSWRNWDGVFVGRWNMKNELIKVEWLQWMIWKADNLSVSSSSEQVNSYSFWRNWDAVSVGEWGIKIRFYQTSWSRSNDYSERWKIWKAGVSSFSSLSEEVNFKFVKKLRRCVGGRRKHEN